jgi:hypothetical protein
MDCDSDLLNSSYGSCYKLVVLVTCSVCILRSCISSWASAKLSRIAILRQRMKLKYSELCKLQHTMLVFVNLPLWLLMSA